MSAKLPPDLMDILDKKTKQYLEASQYFENQSWDYVYRNGFMACFEAMQTRDARIKELEEQLALALDTIEHAKNMEGLSAGNERFLIGRYNFLKGQKP